MAAQLVVPKPSEIRDAILRVIRAKLVAQGVANPNVTATSDYFIIAEAYAQELSILYANLQVAADQQLPDTAEDDDLVRWLAIFELEPREAQPASGSVVLSTSAATFIPTGAQLLAGDGKVFEVTTGGTFSDGDLVPVQATAADAGADTNHPQGYVLTWISSPTFSDPRALVAIGGLTGGANIDTNETSRNRLFDFFRHPPQGGNWPQVAKWATDASASVQAAYVYPALNGPATVAVCVVGPLSFDATNGWTRAVPAAVLTQVTTFLQSRLPEHVDLVCQTPTDTGGTVPNIDTTVAVGLSLPLSVSGGGPGGGWVDAVPWPVLLGTSTRVYVSVATSSTTFTLTSDDAATTPSTVNLQAGETVVAWFSSARFADGLDPIVTATVTDVSGTTGALVVTISEPFDGIAVGDLVMPSAENIQTYAQAYLASMNQMGPGQWTAHPQILVRGSRRPLVTASNPSDLGPTLLRALTDSGDEVLDAAFLYRSTTSPGPPASTTADPPWILVPKTFGFYNKIQ